MYTFIITEYRPQLVLTQELRNIYIMPTGGKMPLGVTTRGRPVRAVSVPVSPTRPTPRRRCQRSGSLSCGGHAGLHGMHPATARPDPAVVSSISLSSWSNHLRRASGRNLNSYVLLLSTRTVLQVSRHDCYSHHMSAHSVSTFCSCTAFQ